MTASTTSQPSASSRRMLLAGMLGGAGAWAASLLGRSAVVRAADGDAMVVGGEYTSTSVTRITNSANASSVIWGESTSGTGVWGTSTSYYGVVGGSSASNRAAVLGKSEPAGNGTGVLGCSGVIPAAPVKTGVYGYAAQDSSAKGVWGYSPSGHGIHGQAAGGVGVYCRSTSGYALRTNGRIKVDKVAGVAVIAAGNVSVQVKPGVNVTSNSFVLLTPRANIGSRALWYTTNASGDSITIHISSSRSSGTRVAWLLLG